jgi:hypothetical protein
MNLRTRRAALYAIGAIAILASANALAHSYAGLYDWAAAFAGLAIGLLVLKMARQRSEASAPEATPGSARALLPSGITADMTLAPRDPSCREAIGAGASHDRTGRGDRDVAASGPDVRLLRAASVIWKDAAARGERLSRRALARQLREHGHRFPNDQLCQIAQSAGLAAGRAA